MSKFIPILDSCIKELNKIAPIENHRFRFAHYDGKYWIEIVERGDISGEIVSPKGNADEIISLISLLWNMVHLVERNMREKEEE